MFEDYNFEEDNEMMQKNDDDLYNNFVIDNDENLQIMNNMVANYFTAFKQL